MNDTGSEETCESFVHTRTSQALSFQICKAAQGQVAALMSNIVYSSSLYMTLLYSKLEF